MLLNIIRYSTKCEFVTFRGHQGPKFKFVKPSKINHLYLGPKSIYIPNFIAILQLLEIFCSQTGRQTNRTENITSLVKVTNKQTNMTENVTSFLEVKNGILKYNAVPSWATGKVSTASKCLFLK